MATISVGSSGLPSSVQAAAQLLLDNGYDQEATPYTLPSAVAKAKGISNGVLNALLTTGVASAPGQKGIVKKHGFDLGTGEITFELNYNLST